ncbi:transposase [Cohnella rhizosphaerae]|uniref:Transposase n=1 Tax=Cohnella rhizosphaerae TaxID=1457232 RepID=A0A9X4KSA8_9BACL|nr:transposase [Cohnella rhizosphaerae]MDG0809633.1 transposase [Cohnella rhizosphaerae]
MPSRFSIQDYVPDYSEEDCAGALFAAKWPDGFRCPRCAHPQYYKLSSRGRQYECKSCAHQTSLTAGTVLEGTRTPLTKWFQAMFLMQIGISAKLLAELIQVTYKTAWLINHKLRHAIGEWDRERPLAGDLQLLAEYYGYEYHRYFGSAFVQGGLRPQPVVVGVSLDGAADVSHVKMKAVDGPEGDHPAVRGGTDGEESVERFVHLHVAGGEASGHVEPLQRGHHGRAAAHHAWLEVMRWLARTFGGIGPKHLQAYLNEFCFRRISRKEALTELIASCGSTKTVTYRGLVGARSGIRPIKWVFRHPARIQQHTG